MQKVTHKHDQYVEVKTRIEPILFFKKGIENYEGEQVGDGAVLFPSGSYPAEEAVISTSVPPWRDQSLGGPASPSMLRNQI